MDWNLPVLTSLYTDFLNLLKGRDDDCAKMFDGVTVSNLPTGAIKWSSANRRLEKWDGNVWIELESNYAISVTRLNDQLASFYTNASNMNAGALPAARFNDTAHGSRAGGSQHALATTIAHGFMSLSDKSKLNGIESNATRDQTKADIDALGIAAETANTAGSITSQGALATRNTVLEPHIGNYAVTGIKLRPMAPGTEVVSQWQGAPVASPVAWPAFAKMIECRAGQAGIVSVYRTHDGPTGQYTKIYVNGISQGNNVTGPGVKMDHVSVNEGDLIQIYGNWSSDQGGDTISDIWVGISTGIGIVGDWRLA